MLVGKVFDEPYAYTPPPASAVSGPFVTADASPALVYAGCPVLEKYDATYVVPAVTATGEEKSSSCHPDAVSSLNVPRRQQRPGRSSTSSRYAPRYRRPPCRTAPR